MGFENNEARKTVLRDVRPGWPAFPWVVPPVLNITTRLIVEMSAAGAGELAARGYKSTSCRHAPEPVTEDFCLVEAAAVL